MHVNEFNFAIFVGIEGAFNNGDPDIIVRALGSLNLGQNLVNLLELLLKSGIINFKVGTTNC